MRIAAIIKFILDNRELIFEVIKMIQDLFGDTQTFTATNYPTIQDACLKTGESMEDLQAQVLAAKEVE